MQVKTRNKLNLEVAAVLAAKRKELGYTLKEFAGQLCLSSRHYSKMERGKYPIPLWVMGSAASIFGIEFMFTVHGIGKENPSRDKTKFEVGDACKLKVNNEARRGIVVEIEEDSFAANVGDVIVKGIPKSKFHRA